MSIRYSLDSQRIKSYIDNAWANDVERTLSQYIEIPNQSPDYDAEIHTNGYQDSVVKLLTEWVLKQKVKGLKLRVLHDEGRTPLIFIEVSPSQPDLNDTVLMYGHFDKQPPLTSDWDSDLHPYKAIIKDGKLYGRGGADDGYAIFAAVNAIKALQAQDVCHPRCCILIEGSEESGSPDLIHYINRLKYFICTPSVVICLDSGCQNYKQLWMTVSLRGVFCANLKVQLLTESIHSGDSGLVRDSFHALRMILDRIDDAKTGSTLRDLYVDIPDKHIQYAKDCAAELGDAVYAQIPFYNGECCTQITDCKESKKRLHELILNRTWRPQVSITGVDGVPGLKGGNVLRKYTTLKLSVRIPPSLDPHQAQSVIKTACEFKPTPFGAHVECAILPQTGGFVCPDYPQWLEQSMHRASWQYFGKRAQFTGEGGSSFQKHSLRKEFPKAQFIVTGILGPKNNAHGPNEFLHIEFTKKVMCCVAHILFDIAHRILETLPSSNKMVINVEQSRAI